MLVLVLTARAEKAAESFSPKLLQLKKFLHYFLGDVFVFGLAIAAPVVFGFAAIFAAVWGDSIFSLSSYPLSLLSVLILAVGGNAKGEAGVGVSSSGRGAGAAGSLLSSLVVEEHWALIVLLSFFFFVAFFVVNMFLALQVNNFHRAQLLWSHRRGAGDLGFETAYPLADEEHEDMGLENEEERWTWRRRLMHYTMWGILYDKVTGRKSFAQTISDVVRPAGGGKAEKKGKTKTGGGKEDEGGKAIEEGDAAQNGAGKTENE